VIVSSAKDNRENFFKALRVKLLFTALYGTYTMMLNELRNILKVCSQTGQTSETDGFKEVRSSKRHSTEEAARTPKKATITETSAKVATKNFFASLRTGNMDTDAPATEPIPATDPVMQQKPTGQPS
jgi:hypothetical protein